MEKGLARYLLVVSGEFAQSELFGIAASYSRMRALGIRGFDLRSQSRPFSPGKMTSATSKSTGSVPR